MFRFDYLAQPATLGACGLLLATCSAAAFAAHVQAETTRWAAAVKAARLEER